MLISKCCKENIHSQTTRCGFHYYLCDSCKFECEIVPSFSSCDMIEKNTSLRDEMPKFSQKSFSKLSTCHHDLQVLFFEVIKYFDCTILEGYRNQEDQEKAFVQGHTKLHYPHGKHNHQPSMAVDVTPYPIDLDNEKLGLWFGGYVMGIAQKLKDEGKMTHSIRWGGSWNGLGDLNEPKQLNDLVHFELVE